MRFFTSKWKNILRPSIPYSVPIIWLPFWAPLCSCTQKNPQIVLIYLPTSQLQTCISALNMHWPLTVDLSPAIVWLLTYSTLKYYKKSGWWAAKKKVKYSTLFLPPKNRFSPCSLESFRNRKLSGMLDNPFLCACEFCHESSRII